MSSFALQNDDKYYLKVKLFDFEDIKEQNGKIGNKIKNNNQYNI